MNDLILLLTASFVYYHSSKEEKLQSIGDTPCSLLFETDSRFYTTFTESGDRLHFGEYGRKGARYGVICGMLTEQLNYEESFYLLTNYINDLRQPFGIAHHLGVVDVPQRQTSFIELHDYWQDDEGVDWEVKGYTNGRYVSVLYVKNITAVPSDRQAAFLNSFSFGA